MNSSFKEMEVKYSMNKTLLEKFKQRIEEENLNFKIEEGETFIDENNDEMVNVLISGEDADIFNDVMCKVMNGMIE